MEQRKPHFFQVMLGDFKNKLQIPLGFLKYICSVSSDRVVLQGPGGRWPVRLNRTSDGVYLEDGWGSFSRAHSLSTGEFVMLRFDGYEHFTVRIFGSDALERDTTCTVTSSPKVTKCDEIKRRGRPPKVGRMIRKKSPSTFLISSSYNQNAENHQKKCVLERRKSRKFDRSDSEAEGINHKRSTFLKHCSRKAEDHEEDCVLERGPYQFDQSDSDKGTSDTSEEGGPIETAKTLMDGNPSFSIIMQPSYKYYLVQPGKSCQICEGNDHITDKPCPLLYIKCKIPGCMGIRQIMEARTEANNGRKFLKCQYMSCIGFQWLDEAIIEARGLVGSSSSNRTFGLQGCFHCGGVGHWKKDCPWIATCCKKCGGVVSLKVSGKKESEGRRYLKCGTCANFEWFSPEDN